MTAVQTSQARPSHGQHGPLDLHRQRSSSAMQRFPQLRHTPGRFTITMVALALLVAIAGITVTWGTQERSEDIDSAANQHGRLGLAAFDMYRALSDADASISAAFLPGQSENIELRESYEAGVSRASAAIATIADEAETKEQVEQVSRLSAMLPSYTGLVETARTYHRQGLPLGIAYLRDASALVRDQMLPIAYELQESSMEELDDASGAARTFPWLSALLLVGTLGALGYSQHRLAKRTNRVINPGVAGATMAVLVTTVWMLVSWGASASHLHTSQAEGTGPLATLSAAHIDAQHARSDEALTLISQGTETDFEADFEERLNTLIGDDGTSGSLVKARDSVSDPKLESLIQEAIDAAGSWRDAHATVRELDDSGQYDSAVAAATSGGDSGIAFASLNDALTQANAIAAERFIDETNKAGSSLTATSVGFSVLMIAAIFGIFIGFTRRISEYR